MDKTKEKIKVCHITSVHKNSDGRIFQKECCSLADSSLYSVYLVAPGESFEKNGVNVVGVEIGKQNRLKRMTATTKAVYQKALEIDADIYHFHDPELLPYGIKLKKMGKKVIYDMHEDVPAQILRKKWIPKLLRKPISMLYKLYEKNSLKKLDLVITVTPVISDRIEKCDVPVGLIHNFPKEKSFVKREAVKKNENVICFAGGVAEQYMHHVILEALSKTNAKYVFAGPGTETYLNYLKSFPEFKKAEYLGVISSDSVDDLHASSQVGMAVIDYTPNVGYKKGTLGVIKIFEYMQAGIPVICTDLEVWEEIVLGNDCGICVNPHDIDGISNAINYLLENPEVAKKMGKNGQKAVKEKYNWGIEEKKLLSLYDTILKK